MKLDGRLLDLLLADGVLSETSHAMLVRFADRWGASDLATILETHTMTEAALADVVAACCRLERIETIAAPAVTPAARALVPFRKARSWQCVPMERAAAADGSRFVVVCADPTRDDVLRLVDTLSEPFSLAVGRRDDILEAVDRFYAPGEQIFTVADAHA